VHRRRFMADMHDLEPRVERRVEHGHHMIAGDANT
jgi:hypothetical protein